jgi:hypothetical protein
MRLCSLNDKSIAKDVLYFFRWSNLKEEVGHLQNIFTMHYTCTFLVVFRLEKRQNIYCHLLKGSCFSMEMDSTL